jgi:hypothetical protein
MRRKINSINCLTTNHKEIIPEGKEFRIKLAHIDGLPKKAFFDDKKLGWKYRFFLTPNKDAILWACIKPATNQLLYTGEFPVSSIQSYFPSTA